MTHPITVQRLLDNPLFQHAEIVTTPQGLHKEICSVTIMDIPNIEKWLSAKELLIVGMFLPTHFTAHFIKRLAQKGIAAVVSKKKFKRALTADLRKELHHLNIPCILIEDHYAWSDVIVAVQNLEIQNKTRLLHETETFHQNIINYIADHQKINLLCAVTQQTLGISLAITTNDFHILDRTDDFAWSQFLVQPQLRALVPLGDDLNNHTVMGFRYQNSELAQSHVILLFMPIYQKGQLSYYLIIKSSSDTHVLDATLLSKLQSVCSIFLLKQSVQQSLQKNTHYLRNIIFEELLKCHQPNPALLSQHSLSLGTRIHEHNICVLVSGAHQNTAQSETRFFTVINQLPQTRLDLSNVHCFTKAHYWVFVTSEKAVFLHQLPFFYDFIKELIPHTTFTIGVSTCQPYWKLNQAFKEAEYASLLAATHSPSLPIQNYQDIGILKLFTNQYGSVNQVFVAELFDNFLNPILNYDMQHNSHLYETLTAFFSNHFSFTNTSKHLFVHVNTLRARLHKIETLLGIDFKNTDHLMNVHIAIRLYQNGHVHPSEDSLP